MQHLSFSSAAAVVALAGLATASGHDEATDGDLSDDHLVPTPFVLDPGSNVFIASQQGDAFGRDIDYFSFVVPSGMVLSSLNLDDFSSSDPDNRGFIGLQEGPFFTVDAGSATAADLLGGRVYGFDQIGQDLLPAMGNLNNAIGFCPPLPESIYTIWLNQTSDPSTATLDLVVTLSPQAYCTAKTGLVCGVPSISALGCPDATETSGWEIRAEPARGNRTGLILYSCSGSAAIPFEGGFLCVSPPIRRTPPTSSGGTNGACDGVFRLDFNAFASGNGGGNPDACLNVPGQQVNAQWWGRDSVQTGSFLSNGLEFDM